MMPVGIIGTGKIGTGVGLRLLRASFPLVVFDAVPAAVKVLQQQGAHVLDSVEQIAQQARVIWILVAHQAVQEIFDRICLSAHPGTIIIDAGNSYYRDSIARFQKALMHKLIFLDCGTSGGVVGTLNGFCLMVGGSRVSYHQLEKQWNAVAAVNGYAYVGGPGSGHYVKMVHNAIEYGMLQAYAEGFALLKECPTRDARLDQIAQLWQAGSLLQSSLLGYYRQALLHVEEVELAGGVLEQGGTAGWALQEALQKLIETPVLRAAITVRIQSKNGNVSFITRLIARVRNLFGGHSW